MLELTDGTPDPPVPLASATCVHKLDRVAEWEMVPPEGLTPEVWARVFRTAGPKWAASADGTALADSLAPIGGLRFAPADPPGKPRFRVLAGYADLLDLLQKHFAGAVGILDADTRTLLQGVKPPGQKWLRSVLPVALTQAWLPDGLFLRTLLGQWNALRPDKPLSLSWAGGKWSAELLARRDQPPADRRVVGEGFHPMDIVALGLGVVGLRLECTRPFDVKAWEGACKQPLPVFVEYGKKWLPVAERLDHFRVERSGAGTVSWRTEVVVSASDIPPPAAPPGRAWDIFDGKAGDARDNLVRVNVNGAEAGFQEVDTFLVTATAGRDLASGLHLVPGKGSAVLVAMACGLNGVAPVCLGVARDRKPTLAEPHLHLAEAFSLLSDEKLELRELKQKAGILVQGGKVSVAK